MGVRTVYKVVGPNNTFTNKRNEADNQLEGPHHQFAPFTSARGARHISDVCLYYDLEVKTRPKYGCIMAFNTLKDAKAFAYAGERILKCKARVSRSKHIPMSPGATRLRNITNLQLGWKSGVGSNLIKKFGYANGVFSWPEGTVFCSWILPKEIIDK